MGTTNATNEAAQWLNTTVPKKFDGDGNHWYGTSGFLCVKKAGSWDVSWANNKTNWSYGGSSTQHSATYLINDPRKEYGLFPSESYNVTPQMSTAGVSADTGNTDNYAWIQSRKNYSHIRVGIMNDLTTTYGDNTTLKVEILSNTGTAEEPVWSVVSNQTLSLNAALNDGKADMYFFDILGVERGQRLRIVGDRYAGVLTVDEVTYAGNIQKSFTASFTEDTNPNYISPTAASTTLLRQDNGVFSSVVVNSLAENDAVNALTFSGLEVGKSFFLEFSEGTQTQTRGLVIDASGVAKVVGLSGMNNVSSMTLSEFTEAATTGNGEIFIDFQGINPTVTNQKSIPLTANEGGIWNAFEFQAHSGTPTVNPSMSLVDSEGTPTSVVLTIEGNVTGWNNDNNNRLMGDYMFAYAGKANRDENGYIGYDFEISGLLPNELYELEFFTSENGGRKTYFTVEGEEKRIDGNDSGIWSVLADEDGFIRGIFASSSTAGLATNSEQNWAALTIRAVDSGVPEPSTWVLLAAGLIGLGWTCRKRKGS
ncbi:MAG: PEP-CTERM sorting domain-containing protein [Planctomycetia bacterium]|nr:PEP-CTERM sorting domain-containing protein [Planctomycetia bacterium]